MPQPKPDAAAQRKSARQAMIAEMRASLREAVTELCEKVDPPEARGKQTAQRLGISQPQISGMKNLNRLPKADTLAIMREALGRSIDSILGLPPLARPDRAQMRQFLGKFDEHTLRSFRRLIDELLGDDAINADLADAEKITRPMLPPVAVVEVPDHLDEVSSQKSDKQVRSRTNRKTKR